jgi:hypothetical protein
MFEAKRMPYFVERNRPIQVRGIVLADRPKAHGWLVLQHQCMLANRTPSLRLKEGDAYVGKRGVILDRYEIDVGVFGEGPFDDGLLSPGAAEE